MTIDHTVTRDISSRQDTESRKSVDRKVYIWALFADTNLRCQNRVDNVPSTLPFSIVLHNDATVLSRVEKRTLCSNEMENAPLAANLQLFQVKLSTSISIHPP